MSTTVFKVLRNFCRTFMQTLAAQEIIIVSEFFIYTLYTLCSKKVTPKFKSL